MKLFLTDLEREILAQASRKQTFGPHVISAAVDYQDSTEKRAMRLRHCQVEAPSLKALIATLNAHESEQEMLLAREFSNIEISSVSHDDLTEVLFAIGPDSISSLIQFLLKDFRNRACLKLAAALSTIREMLFGSLLKSESRMEL